MWDLKGRLRAARTAAPLSVAPLQGLSSPCSSWESFASLSLTACDTCA
jgi:hypothetical protein